MCMYCCLCWSNNVINVRNRGTIGGCQMPSMLDDHGYDSIESNVWSFNQKHVLLPQETIVHFIRQLIQYGHHVAYNWSTIVYFVSDYASVRRLYDHDEVNVSKPKFVRHNIAESDSVPGDSFRIQPNFESFQGTVRRLCFERALRHLENWIHKAFRWRMHLLGNSCSGDTQSRFSRRVKRFLRTWIMPTRMSSSALKDETAGPRRWRRIKTFTSATNTAKPGEKILDTIQPVPSNLFAK